MTEHDRAWLSEWVRVSGPATPTKRAYVEELLRRFPDAFIVSTSGPPSEEIHEGTVELEHTTGLEESTVENYEKMFGASRASRTPRNMRKFMTRRVETLFGEAKESTRQAAATMELELNRIYRERTSPIVRERDRVLLELKERYERDAQAVRDAFDKELRPDLDTVNDLRETLRAGLEVKLRVFDKKRKQMLHEYRHWKPEKEP